MMRAHRWGVSLAFAILVAAVSPAVALDTHVVSASGDGTRLVVDLDVPEPVRSLTELDGIPFARYEIPGFRPEGSPGAPARAVGSVLLAVPPGGRATVRVLDATIEDAGIQRLLPQPRLIATYANAASGDAPPSAAMPLEIVEYDPEAYVADGVQDEPVRLGARGRLRHLDVVPLEVRPLLYDPQRGTLRIVRRLRVEIRIHSDPRAAKGDAARARLATDAAWQRVYDRTLLNAGQAGAWMGAPPRVERTLAPLKNGLLRPGLLGEDEWKLRVRSTGPLRVRADILLQAGFPDGTPVERLRLVLKRWNPASPLDPSIIEIPILVEDADADGLFRTGDAFVFYAEQPRDDGTAGERAQRYSFDNVYWLSVADTGTPVRMPVRAPVAGALPGPATFEQFLHDEEDRQINLWVFSDDSELYHMVNQVRDGQEARHAVALPGRSAGADVEICLLTQQDWLRRPFTAFAEMTSGTRVELGSFLGFPPSQPPRLGMLCATVPGSQIEPGNVTVVLRPDPGNHGFVDKTPFLDAVELRYMADYVAVNDHLRCTSGGASGPTAFTISGWTATELLALDITNPKAPAVFDLAGALAGGVLTLTDNVPAGAPRTYEILDRATLPALQASAVEQDTADPILDDLATLPMGSYDVLVVTHDRFADEPRLADWVAFRESQGHRVRVVRTSDAYDAFNGGLLHYDPIHRLVKLAFQNWGIGYVLLIGDGSEDAAGLLPESGPNLVPARVKYFLVQASGGAGGLEYRNDMNDRHYAKMDDGIDFWPDLLVGRWPVNTVEELRNVIDKTLLYENPLPEDDGAWRKRVLMFADDEWIRRTVPGLPGIAHRRGCVEPKFEASIARACETVDGAFPGDLHCVRYFLRFMSDQLVDRIPEHAAWDFDTMPANCSSSSYVAAHTSGGIETFFYQGDAPRALTDSIGDGVLFFALQAHANRNVVTDEFVVRKRQPFEPDFRNHGKPFVFFGLGCHLNEFGVPGENATSFGDALGELYVTVPERAAVASYASTGFEFLSANNAFHELMWRAFFEKRFARGLGGGAVDSDTLEADWLLAELLQVSEISYADANIIDRYALLGDPLLHLDAGVPRFAVDAITNGFLREGNRIGALDPSQPVRITMTVNDEQGIDSLWVEKRFLAGGREPITDVVITANLDTLPEIRAKRSYTLQFEVLIDQCDFDVVVGARDRAGRVSEFVGRALFDTRLLANGLELRDGDVIDPRTAFRFEILGCAPLPSPLPLKVFLDGEEIAVDLQPDSLQVNWTVAFDSNLPAGPHTLRFEFSGSEILSLTVNVSGGFGLSSVYAFPNPFAERTAVYFKLDSPVAGGYLRIMDLNGRTVRRIDLASGLDWQGRDPARAAGARFGTSVGWNWVPWDGTDRMGDRVANGVYLYELRVEDTEGRALRRVDKIVLLD